MQKKTHRQLVKKTVSWLTLLLFTAAELVQASVLPLHGSIEHLTGTSSNLEVTLPAFVHEVQLPETLGTVQGRYLPAEDVRKAVDYPVILHIQDAHASLDAQNSIEKILNHLKSEYGVSTIFLEGVTREANPELLQFFKEKSQNLQLAKLLQKDSLIGGTEHFLLKQLLESGERVVAHGVEEPALYRQNLQDFREVFRSKEETDSFLAEFKTHLLTLSSHFFSKDLRYYFKEWYSHQDNPQEQMRRFEALNGYTKEVLEVNLEEPSSQKDWPQLTRFASLKMIEKRLDLSQAFREFETLKNWMDAKGLKVEELEALAPAAGMSLKVDQPRRVLESLFDQIQPHGFYFESYPSLSAYWGFGMLRSEISALLLLEEMTEISDKVLEKLANQEASELLNLYRRYVMLEKLLNLELTEEEYQRVLEKASEFLPSKMLEEIRTFHHRVLESKGVSNRHHISPAFRYTAPDPPYNTALRFYEGAAARDEKIFQKMISKMKELQDPHAILITGGFHARALQERFRKEEIAYLEIMPAIGDLENENAYWQTMILKGDYETRRSYANHPSVTDGGIVYLDEVLPEHAAHMESVLRINVRSVAAQGSASTAEVIAEINESAAALGHGIVLEDETGDAAVGARSEARSAGPREVTRLKSLASRTGIVTGLLLTSLAGGAISHYLLQSEPKEDAQVMSAEEKQKLVDEVIAKIGPVVQQYLQEEREKNKLAVQVDQIMVRREVQREAAKRGLGPGDIKEDAEGWDEIENLDDVRQKILEYDTRKVVVDTAVKRAREAGITGVDLQRVENDPTQLPDVLTEMEKIRTRAIRLKAQKLLTGTMDEIREKLDEAEQRASLLERAKQNLVGEDYTNIESMSDADVENQIQRVTELREKLATEMRKYGATDEDVQEAATGRTIAEMEAGLEAVKALKVAKLPTLASVPGGKSVPYLKGLSAEQRVQMARQLIWGHAEFDELRKQVEEKDLSVRHYTLEELPDWMQAEYQALKPIIVRLLDQMGQQTVMPDADSFDSRYPTPLDWYASFFSKVLAAQGYRDYRAKQFLAYASANLRVTGNEPFMRQYREFLVANYWDERDGERFINSQDAWRPLDNRFRAHLKKLDKPEQSLMFTLGNAFEWAELRMQEHHLNIQRSWAKTKVLEEDNELLPANERNAGPGFNQLLEEGIRYARGNRQFSEDIEVRLLKQMRDPNFKPDMATLEAGSNYSDLRILLYPNMDTFVGTEPLYFNRITDARFPWVHQDKFDESYTPEIALQVVAQTVPAGVYFPVNNGMPFSNSNDIQYGRRGVASLSSYRVRGVQTQLDVFGVELMTFFAENPILWKAESLAPNQKPISNPTDVFPQETAKAFMQDFWKLVNLRTDDGNRLVYRFLSRDYGEWIGPFTDWFLNGYAEENVFRTDKSKGEVGLTEGGAKFVDEELVPKIREMLKVDEQGNRIIDGIPPRFQVALRALLARYDHVKVRDADDPTSPRAFRDLSSIQQELYYWSADMARNAVTKVLFAMQGDAAKRGEGYDLVVRKMEVMLAIRDGVEHFYGRPMRLHKPDDIGRWSSFADQVIKLGVDPELFNALLVLMKTEEVQNQTKELMGAITGKKIESLEIEDEFLGPLHTSYLQFVALNIRSEEEYQEWLNIFSDRDTKYTVEISETIEGRVVLENDRDSLKKEVTLSLPELIVQIANLGRFTHSDGTAPLFDSEDLANIAGDDDYLSYVIPEAQRLILELRPMAEEMQSLEPEARALRMQQVIRDWIQSRDRSITTQQRAGKIAIPPPRSEARSPEGPNRVRSVLKMTGIASSMVLLGIGGGILQNYFERAEPKPEVKVLTPEQQQAQIDQTVKQLSEAYVKELQRQLPDMIHEILNRRELMQAAKERGLDMEELKGLEDGVIIEMIAKIDAENALIEATVKKAKGYGLADKDAEALRENPEELPTVLQAYDNLLAEVTRLRIPLRDIQGLTMENIRKHMDGVRAQVKAEQDAEGKLFGEDLRDINPGNIGIRLTEVEEARIKIMELARATGADAKAIAQLETEVKTATTREILERIEIIEKFGQILPLSAEPITLEEFLSKIEDYTLEDLQLILRAYDIDPLKLLTTAPRNDVVQNITIDDLDPTERAEWERVQGKVQNILNLVGHTEEVLSDPNYQGLQTVDWFKRIARVTGGILHKQGPEAAETFFTYLEREVGRRLALYKELGATRHDITNQDWQWFSGHFSPKETKIAERVWKAHQTENDLPDISIIQVIATSIANVHRTTHSAHFDADTVADSLRDEYIDEKLREHDSKDEWVAKFFGALRKDNQIDGRLWKRIYALDKIRQGQLIEVVEPTIFDDYFDTNNPQHFSILMTAARNAIQEAMKNGKASNMVYPTYERDFDRFVVRRPDQIRAMIPQPKLEPVLPSSGSSMGGVSAISQGGNRGDDEIGQLRQQIDQRFAQIDQAMQNLNIALSRRINFADYNIRRAEREGLIRDMVTDQSNYLYQRSNDKRLLRVESQTEVVDRFAKKLVQFWLSRPRELWVNPDGRDPADMHTGAAFEAFARDVFAVIESGALDVLLHRDLGEVLLGHATAHFDGSIINLIRVDKHGYLDPRNPDFSQYLEDMADALTFARDPYGKTPFDNLSVSHQGMLSELIATRENFYKEIDGLMRLLDHVEEGAKRQEILGNISAKSYQLRELRADFYSFLREVVVDIYFNTAMNEVAEARGEGISSHGILLDRIVRKGETVRPVFEQVHQRKFQILRVQPDGENDGGILSAAVHEVSAEPVVWGAVTLAAGKDQIKKEAAQLFELMTGQKDVTFDFKGPDKDLHFAFSRFWAAASLHDRLEDWVKLFSDPVKREKLIELASRARVAHTNGAQKPFTSEDIFKITSEDDFFSYLIPEALGFFKRALDYDSEREWEAYVRGRETSLETQEKAIEAVTPRSEARVTKRQTLVTVALTSLITGGVISTTDLWLTPYFVESQVQDDEFPLEERQIFRKAIKSLADKAMEMEDQMEDEKFVERVKGVNARLELLNEAAEVGIPEDEIKGLEDDAIRQKITEVLAERKLIEVALDRAKQAGIQAPEDLSDIEQHPEKLPEYLTTVEDLRNRVTRLDDVDFDAMTGTLEELETQIVALEERKAVIDQAKAVLVGDDAEGIEDLPSDQINDYVRAVTELREELAQILREKGMEDPAEIERLTADKTRAQLAQWIAAVDVFGANPIFLENLSLSELVEKLDELSAVQLRHLISSEHYQSQLDEVLYPEPSFEHATLEDLDPDQVLALESLKETLDRVAVALGLPQNDPELFNTTDWYLAWNRYFTVSGISGDRAQRFLEYLLVALPQRLALYDEFGIEAKTLEEYIASSAQNFSHRWQLTGDIFMTPDLWEEHELKSTLKLPVRVVLGSAIEHARGALAHEVLDRVVWENHPLAKKSVEAIEELEITRNLHLASLRNPQDPIVEQYRSRIVNWQNAEFKSMESLHRNRGDFATTHSVLSNLLGLNQGFQAAANRNEYIRLIDPHVHNWQYPIRLPRRITKVETRVRNQLEGLQREMLETQINTKRAQNYASQMVITHATQPSLWKTAKMREQDGSRKKVVNPRDYNDIFDLESMKQYRDYWVRLRDSGIVWELYRPELGDFLIDFMKRHETGSADIPNVDRGYQLTQNPVIEWNGVVKSYVEHLGDEVEAHLDYFPPEVRSLLVYTLERYRWLQVHPEAKKSHTETSVADGEFYLAVADILQNWAVGLPLLEIADGLKIDLENYEDFEERVRLKVLLRKISEGMENRPFRLFLNPNDSGSISAEASDLVRLKIEVEPYAVATKLASLPEIQTEALSVWQAIMRDDLQAFDVKSRETAALHKSFLRWWAGYGSPEKAKQWAELMNDDEKRSKIIEIAGQLREIHTGGRESVFTEEDLNTMTKRDNYPSYILPEIRSFFLEDKSWEEWVLTREIVIKLLKSAQQRERSEARVATDIVKPVNMTDLVAEITSRGRITEAEIARERLLDIMKVTQDVNNSIFSRAERHLRAIDENGKLHGPEGRNALNLALNFVAINILVFEPTHQHRVEVAREQLARVIVGARVFRRDTIEDTALKALRSIVLHQITDNRVIATEEVVAQYEAVYPYVRSEARIAIPTDQIESHLADYGASLKSVVSVSRAVSNRIISEDHRITPEVYEALLALVLEAEQARGRKVTLEELRSEIDQSIADMQLLAAVNTIRTGAGGVVVLSPQGPLAEEGVPVLFAKYLLEVAGVDPNRKVIIGGDNVAIRDAIFSRTNQTVDRTALGDLHRILELPPSHRGLDEVIKETVKREGQRRSVAVQTSKYEASELSQILNEVLNFVDDHRDLASRRLSVVEKAEALFARTMMVLDVVSNLSIEAEKLKEEEYRAKVVGLVRQELVKRYKDLKVNISPDGKSIVLSLSEISLKLQQWKLVAKAA